MPSLKQQINWLLRDKYRNRLTPAVKKDIGRLKQGEPLDYIIGWKEFLGCKIDLSLRPLIPRQETEFWVERAITLIKNARHSERSEESRGCYGGAGCGPRSFGLRPQDDPIKNPISNEDDNTIQCLDLFSGSGCIGIAILKHIPQAKVDFTDIDKNCLKQIKTNLKINKISKSRYRLFRTDIFNRVLQTTNYKLKTYNYILANPPYINLKNKTRLQKSVLKYEPHQALFSRQNGLYFIDQTLRQAKKYLRLDGQLFLEFSPEQKNAITILLKKYQYSKWRFNKDQFNRWRWLNANK